MEELNDYYKERERKNEELIVTMGYAMAIGFSLMCLWGAGKLVIMIIRWLL